MLKLLLKPGEGEVKKNSGVGEFKYDIFVNAKMHPYPTK
jgi:hypothetical protein